MSQHTCTPPVGGPTTESKTWQCPKLECRKWYEWNSIVRRWYRREAWEVRV